MAAYRMCRFVNNFHKQAHNLLKYSHQNIEKNSHMIHTAIPLKIREVTLKTEGDVTVIEGRDFDSERKDHLMNLPGDPKMCPLCRLNMDIKYTDVLILSQFVQEDGEVFPKQVSGLCFPQYKRVRRLVHQAHRAGLMQHLRPHLYPEEYSQMSQFAWKKYNVYFTELFDHDH